MVGHFLYTIAFVVIAEKGFYNKHFLHQYSSNRSRCGHNKASEERSAPPMLLLYGDAVFFYGASFCLILIADAEFAGSYQGFAVFADGDSGDLELFRYFPCG